MALDDQRATDYPGAPMGAPVFRFDLERRGWCATLECGCDVFSFLDWRSSSPPRLVPCLAHAELPPGSNSVALATCQVHGTELRCAKCEGARGGRVLSDAKRAQLAAAARRPRPSRRKEPATKPAPRKRRDKASSRKTKGLEDGYR